MPQVSYEQDTLIKDNDSQFEIAMVSVAWGNLILNLILSKGFKHLWGLVNLLQFLIFFLEWNVNYTYDVQSFLKSAKSLALMEFLPTEWFIE